MFFKWKKKNSKKKKELSESLQKEIQENQLKDPAKIEHYVVGQCEQMIELSKELGEIRGEYKIVTSYLNDIQIIENLSQEAKKQIVESAGNIATLNQARNALLNTEQKISDVQFAQMQEEEDEIPDAINRLKSNEEYLDLVKRDMNYLEGEKTEWNYHRHQCKKGQKRLQSLSYALLALFVGIAVLLLLLSFGFQMDTQFLMVVTAFSATVCGAYVILKYQDYASEIRKSEVNINHAITMENHVKIRYVNMKNAVDYACEKYHVRNSYELNYVWEQYAEAVKEREKFKQTNEDLEYYNNKLLRQLKGYHLYDAKIWLNHANALVNPKEMVEVKHNLFARRQKLRTQMETYVDTITKMKDEVLRYSARLPKISEPIKRIVMKIERIIRTEPQ